MMNPGSEVQVDVHPSLKQRKIIHIDMDAFYAAVEILDDPSLAGKPLIVGGSPTSRGVVTTASYEARKFGVRSAIPCSHAARLCPQAIFVRPRFERYREISQQIRAIFARYAERIEPLSLDEAYLDVTGYADYASKIALRIRRTIFEELKLTASAGVGPNKLIAKIASDMRKPNGQTVVQPHEVAGFMQPLSVRKIPGVGPVTADKLAKIGILTCADVMKHSEAELTEKLARLGEWLYRKAQGLDDREVSADRVRKSLGHERTFMTDIGDRGRLHVELERLCGLLREDVEKRHIIGRTLTLKIKYADFTVNTRARSSSDKKFWRSDDFFPQARAIFDSEWQAARPIRLLGVSLSRLSEQHDA